MYDMKIIVLASQYFIYFTYPVFVRPQVLLAKNALASVCPSSYQLCTKVSVGRVERVLGRIARYDTTDILPEN